MRLKTLALAVAALAVVSLVVYFVRRPAPPAAADARLNQPLVDQSVVEQAAKLRIADQGKTVTVARDATGTWRVADYHDFPADFQKLSTFIGNLTDAKIQRLATSHPERLQRLEFKDTKIELLDSADKTLWSVTLGKHSDTGGGRYVRFGDEQKGYLANLNAWLDTEPKNWANSELLKLAADDVAKLEIPFADGGPIVVSREKKEDPWASGQTPENQKVKADKIASTLSTLGNIRFSDTASLDDPNVAAAKQNLRTFKLTTFDGKTIAIGVGRKPEEKKPKPATAAAAAPADAEKKDGEPAPGSDGKAGETKPAEPEFETIPAGPVYVFIEHSDPSAPVNALMQKRAFQVYEYLLTSLPQKPEELFEPAPAAPSAAPAASTPSPAEPHKD